MPQDYVQTEVGAIQIAPSVFEAIATSAAMSISGVAQMSTSFVQDFFGKKGVKVEIGEESVVIHVSIVVEYGKQIPPIVRQIQEKIQEEIEEMTGFLVKACHVSIQGVHVPDPEKKRHEANQPMKSRSIT
jgi:uncharacterized alkaline shock family protein YloU